MLPGIGRSHIQRVLDAPADLKKCEQEISRLKNGLDNVHNREKIFQEQEQRIIQFRAIASELKTAIADAKPHCLSYRKYKSPWKRSENMRPFVRHKHDQIYITPRKGIKRYWAEKIDRVFNTNITVAPSKYDGGYNEASAKITQLNEYTGARIDGVGKRTDLAILEEISNLEIQRQAVQNNVVSMQKYEHALDELRPKQEKYQDRVAIKQKMTEAAFNLLSMPNAVDYINRETDKKPKLPEILKDVSRKDLTRLLNDGFAASVSKESGSYHYEAHLSSKEIDAYKNRLRDQVSVPIKKFMQVEPAPSNRTDANVIFVIDGKPSDAQVGDAHYKVFRQDCRYKTTAIDDAQNGKIHIHLQQVRSSASAV